VRLARATQRGGRAFPLQVSPFIVRTMARARILGASAARLATDLRALQQRSRAEIVHRIESGSNALARLLE
jgi:hypothetical protein